MKVRYLQVEPTTRCNYTCGFCVGRHLPQKDLSLDRFRSLIEQVEGLEALELQGEGEPLMHPDFFRMVALAKARFPAVEISMITNGSLFTAENIEQILDHGIARIFVSVESVDDAEFQRIRGGKLDRVRRGIRALLEARNDRGMTRPVIGLSVTALKSTVPELAEAIPAFYRSLGLDGGANVQKLQKMPQFTRVYDQQMLEEIPDAAARQGIQAALKHSPALNSVVSERMREGAIGFYERLYTSVDMRFSCPWLVNGLYLATGGELVPCCHVKDYQRYELANLDEGLEGCESKRAAIRAELSSGKCPEVCEGCEVAEIVVANSARMRAEIQRRFR